VAAPQAAARRFANEQRDALAMLAKAVGSKK
jgi:hypothetical protein